MSSDEANSEGHAQWAPDQRIQQCLRAKDEVLKYFKVIQINQKVIFETSFIYRVQLAIVGDFSKFNSKSLNDFIYESNRGKHIGFFKDTDSAIQFLSGI